MNDYLLDDNIILIVPDWEYESHSNLAASTEWKYANIIKLRIEKIQSNQQYVILSSYQIPNGRAFELNIINKDNK